MANTKRDAFTLNSAIVLDLTDVDLKVMSALEGTALESIIRELRDESNTDGFARHSSHSSYSTHGQVAW